MPLHQSVGQPSGHRVHRTYGLRASTYQADGEHHPPDMVLVAVVRHRPPMHVATATAEVHAAAPWPRAPWSGDT